MIFLSKLQKGMVHWTHPLLTFTLLWGVYCIQAKAQNDTIQGKASYYSDKLQGHIMSNGERYNKDSLTCAHRELAFGTILKILNLKNNREVTVRVTDRGPHSKRFIIDLSKAAAKELDMIKSGTANVNIVVFAPQEIPYKLPKKGILLHPDWNEDSLRVHYIID